MIIIAHCELHDSVNHLKVERILFFRVILDSMFSQCFHCVSGVCVCVRVCVLLLVCVCVCVQG